jgi:hypothetical protein
MFHSPSHHFLYAPSLAISFSYCIILSHSHVSGYPPPTVHPFRPPTTRYMYGRGVEKNFAQAAALYQAAAEQKVKNSLTNLGALHEQVRWGHSSFITLIIEIEWKGSDVSSCFCRLQFFENESFSQIKRAKE